MVGSINLSNNHNLTWGGSYAPNIPTIASSVKHGIFFYPAGSTSGSSMHIDLAGNVGIGTTTSAQNFVVSKNGGEGFEVYLGQPSETVGLQAFNRSNSTYTNMRFDAQSYLFHLGNVGIRTLNPQEMLSVNGKIRAHEIRVETAN